MTALEVYAIDQLPAVGPAAVCMGVFDGVHRGHLALVRATITAARERGAASVALVFDPHPDQVVRPGTLVPRLAPLADNLHRLHAAGIDQALPVRFDAALRGLTPEEFLAALSPAIGLRALVMTPESAFGRNRAGTPDAMRAHGREAGFDLVLAEPVVDERGAISSARIRAALAAGDVEGAASMLGHPPYLEGAVADRGLAGRRVRFGYSPALPAPGRYPAAVREAEDRRGEAREAILEVGADGQARLDGRIAALPDGPMTIELRAAP